MASLSFVSGSRTDKSFQVGLLLVILFAVTEFFAASFHYISRMRPAPTVVAAPRAVPAPLPSVAAPSAPPVALAVASPNAGLTSAIAAFDAAAVPPALVQKYNDTVLAYERNRDGALRGIVANLDGYDPHPTLQLATP